MSDKNACTINGEPDGLTSFEAIWLAQQFGISIEAVHNWANGSSPEHVGKILGRPIPYQVTGRKVHASPPVCAHIE